MTCNYSLLCHFQVKASSTLKIKHSSLLCVTVYILFQLSMRLHFQIPMTSSVLLAGAIR